MAAATGAMAAHFARGTHGKGQHVDISVQQVAFSRNTNGILVWQFDRQKLRRAGGSLAYGKATVRAIWKLADGWCFHSLMTGRLGRARQPGPFRLDGRNRHGQPTARHGLAELQSVHATGGDARTLGSFHRGILRQQDEGRDCERGSSTGINACVVNEPADVLADRHLAARDFFTTPSGLPERFAIFGESAGSTKAPTIRKGDRPGPLAGVRVLDFAWALVGSITTKTLGDLGAEIVKIESRTRPDLARLDVQVSASKAGNWDDKPWFAHLNSSKRSLSLNMKRPAGARIARSSHRLGGRGGRKFLTRHHEEARPLI